jgi:hypothetical protein
MTETNKIEKIRRDMDLNRRLAQFDYQKVRDNQDLTTEAKERQLQTIYEKAQAKHQRLREAAEAERVKVKEEAKQKLYERPIPKSVRGAERETFLMSLRDAAARVQQAPVDPKNPSAELRKIYEQAARVGDETLKYAVFARGLDLALQGGFMDRHLDEKSLREAYAAASADDRVELLDRALDTKGPAKPSELMGQRVSLR